MDQTSPSNAEKFLPQRRNWLSLKLRYKGRGKVYFSNPEGIIEGKASVSYDETGEAKIELKAEWLTIEGSKRTKISLKNFRDFIANVDGPDNMIAYPIATRNPCKQITVSTSKGLYTTSKIGSYFVPSQFVIKIYPLSSEFGAVRIENSEKYFVIPLLNFVPDPSSFRWHGLWQHPLRMYVFPDIPDNLTDDEKAWLTHNFLSKMFLSFKFKDGKDAFIEPLPDFSKRREKLLSHKTSSLVTAVLVGEVSSILDFDQSLAFDKSKVPNTLLSLLSLTTGSRVGSPWIELRDMDGNLVRRIHTSLARSAFKPGLGVIPATLPSEKGSIERLLEQAQTSEDFTKQYVRAVISQIVFSGYLETDGNIEDQMSFVFRGLEKLCDMRKSEIGTGKLEDTFTTSEVASKVKQVLTSTINSLDGISDELGKRDPQKNSVGNIRRDIQKLLIPELGFGKLILDVLRHNKLYDYEVLEPYYKTRPYDHKNKWIDSVVNKNGRNDIFHRAWFDWETEPPNMEEVGAIHYHLRDILIRLILIALKYDGHYQPNLRNVLDLGDQPVDWVKPSTMPRLLGY